MLSMEESKNKLFIHFVSPVHTLNIIYPLGKLLSLISGSWQGRKHFVVSTSKLLTPVKL